MESTFLSTTPLLSFAKTMNPTSRTPLVWSFGRLNNFKSVSIKYRTKCLGTESGGGGGGSFGKHENGGGGGGGSDAAASPVVLSASSSDVILLHVGGMTCGGCAASVKRILETQPQVSSAVVDLTTETATVYPATDAMDGPDWRLHLGEALAKHLTSCGFASKLKGPGSNEGDASS